MKKYLRLVLLLSIVLAASGCTGKQAQNTATIELKGNPTTGYSWTYTMAPDGVVSEVSNEYVADKASEGVVGSGGTFVFKFEAVAQGEAELVFSYHRVWEEDVPALETVTYKAVVDDSNNLALTKEE